MDIETTLDPDFSDPAAEPTPWATASADLEAAKTYFVVTVRPDGRPHATTVAGVWLDGAFHFVTGPSERKAKNLAAGNADVLVATGCNRWGGLDIVLEGEAVRVTDPHRLDRIVDAMTRKYDDFFGMRVVGGRLMVEGATDEGLAFEVRATTGFGFAKAPRFGQTRWRF